MKRLFFGPLALAMLLLTATTASAELTWLIYDDGEPDREEHVCGLNDIYTMRMTPLMPGTVNQLWFRALREGTLEVHFWPDRDGLPDMDWDLTEPFEVETVAEEKDYFIMLDELAIAIDPPREFHVGFVRKTDKGAQMVMDATVDHALRAKYRLNGEWIENEKDWIVSVQMNYSSTPDSYYYTNVTAVAGITDLGSRHAWGDYDNDGDLDLLMSGPILYRNEGDGTFANVTAAAGISGIGANGCLWADFDNDGDLDFFAMNGGLEDYDRFMRNNGDGTFTDITDTALAEEDRDFNPSEGAGWGDYNRDGYLDLFLANYEMPGDDLGIGTRDRLYRNNGDGTFTDVADDLNIDVETANGDYLCGRGVNWGDFNDDGWPDIYVSNYRLDPNDLYMNNGDGTFTEVSLAKGVRGYEVNGSWGHTIGSAWGDFNNDAYLDLFNANLAHPRYAGFSDTSFLFINNGPPDY